MKMVQIALNYAIAILLAIDAFGSTRGEMLLDSIDPETARVQTTRIVAIDPGRSGFNMLYLSNGEWVVSGQVYAVKGSKSAYRFGDPRAGAPIELGKTIQNFEKVADLAVTDASFDAKIGDESGSFRLVRSGDAMILLDVKKKAVFVLHPAPKK